MELSGVRVAVDVTAVAPPPPEPQGAPAVVALRLVSNFMQSLAAGVEPSIVTKRVEALVDDTVPTVGGLPPPPPSIGLLAVKSPLLAIEVVVGK
jgi:hypothetical protein